MAPKAAKVYSANLFRGDSALIYRYHWITYRQAIEDIHETGEALAAFGFSVRSWSIRSYTVPYKIRFRAVRYLNRQAAVSIDSEPASLFTAYAQCVRRCTHCE